MSDHHCEWCGGSFSPKRAHARFCTDAHRAEAWKASKATGTPQTTGERVPHSGGAQLSYRKTIQMLEQAGIPNAKALLLPVVPVAQRARIK